MPLSCLMSPNRGRDPIAIQSYNCKQIRLPVASNPYWQSYLRSLYDSSITSKLLRGLFLVLVYFKLQAKGGNGNGNQLMDLLHSTKTTSLPGCTHGPRKSWVLCHRMPLPLQDLKAPFNIFALSETLTFVICRLVSSGTTLVQNGQFYSVQRLQVISSLRLIWISLLFILIKFVLIGLSAFQTRCEPNTNICTAIVKPFCLLHFRVRIFVILCRDKQCFQVIKTNFAFFYLFLFEEKNKKGEMGGA